MKKTNILRIVCLTLILIFFTNSSLTAIGYGKSTTISSIDNIIVELKPNSTYSLPKTVSAVMGNHTTRDFSVLWNTKNVNTSKVGENIYYGKVAGYSKEVKLTLIILAPIVFNDINMEKVIRDTINRPTGSIYKTDLKSILDLSLNDKNITDISGIENLVNLTHLNLSNNQIVNIDALKNLSKLIDLDLSINQISNINSLKSLTNLLFLRLNNNKITNIDVVKNFRKLYSLSLECNQIVNIDSVKNLSNLQLIDLSENQIVSMDALKSLGNLMYIDSEKNQIKDIDFLKGLSKLCSLNLRNNQIVNVDAIKNLTRLVSLSLSNNKIQEIQTIGRLTNLETLRLNDNEIVSINAIQNLTKLKHLDLSNNKILQIENLKNLINLEYLYLNNNQIVNINCLKNFSNLKSLVLDDNQINNIDALKGLTKLDYLSLRDNKIAFIDSIKYLTSLNTLYLNGNPIVDISPIAGLNKLTDFDYQFASISQTLEYYKKAREIINEIINPNMTEYEKELAIHDYIVNNTKYDYDNYINNTIPTESYSPYGVLMKGVGVCNGYAQTTFLLLNMAGIENITVYGSAYGIPSWEGHAWNIVKVGGQYYHIDTTWDAPGVYKYFNITDDAMSTDHQWDKTKYPECTDTTYKYK